MRKTKKQLMKSGIAGLLIASMAVGGGTLAYLTDAETTDNTFTVGKVKIALTEPNYPGNESEQVQDLVPNEIVKKDPQVQNTGINDAIIYLKVEVPKANVTVVEDGGARGDKKVQEIFALKNLKTGDDGTWMEIRKDDSSTDKCIYVFAYKIKLAKDATTTPLFDEVQLKNVLEKEIDATTQDIKINAYAIQADNILDVDTATLDKTTLDKVYDIYVNQSGDKDKQADDKDDEKSGVATLLSGSEVNAKMKDLAGSTADVSTADTAIVAIQPADAAPTNAVVNNPDSLISANGSEKPVYAWFEDGTIHLWSDAKTIEAGSDLSHLCSKMTSLSDISGLTDLDTSNTTTMDHVFDGCTSLADTSAVNNWNVSNVTSFAEMCKDTPSHPEFSNVAGSWKSDGTFVLKGEEKSATLLDGISLQTKMIRLSNDSASIKAIHHSNEKPSTAVMENSNSLISTDDSEEPVYMWFEDGTIKWWSEASKVMAGSSLHFLCKDFTSLNDISGLADWNTQNVTDMTCTFYNCSNLTNLSGLNSWNTSNVITMHGMFGTCSKLADISALKNWDVSNVLYMGKNDVYNHTHEISAQTVYIGMFQGCSSLNDLTPLANWNVGNVEDISSMFSRCGSLNNLTPLKNWNVGKISDFSGAFGSCVSLTKLSGLENWDVSNATDMNNMFSGCNKLTDASAINDWNITNVTNFMSMFNSCPSHPKFTKRAGTWDDGKLISMGTFTPTT